MAIILFLKEHREEKLFQSAISLIWQISYELKFPNLCYLGNHVIMYQFEM